MWVMDHNHDARIETHAPFQPEQVIRTGKEVFFRREQVFRIAGQGACSREQVFRTAKEVWFRPEHLIATARQVCSRREPVMTAGRNAPFFCGACAGLNGARRPALGRSVV